MSHYTRIQTQITDLDCLKKALADMGFPDVEFGDKIPLDGWPGDEKRTADIVIRKKYLPHAIGDIGFVKQCDGSYSCIITDVDTILLPSFENEVTKRYAEHLLMKNLNKTFLQLAERSSDPNGSIIIKLRSYLNKSPAQSSKTNTPEVEITIKKDKEVTVDVKGEKGPKCKDLTRSIELALGKQLEIKYKPEYSEGKVVRPDLVKGM